jgi:multimeric flavodoxin WrbA
MRLLAITAGRKLGNSEILAKEVLMTAENLGAEVQMINLHDYHIKPCTGCETCVLEVTNGKKPKCIHSGKDDMEKIMQEVLPVDGLLVVIPTYMLQPAGIYKVFVDRLISYVPAFLFESKMIDRLPQRVAGIIAVGGSTQTWMSMALPFLYSSTLSQSTKIVDQLLATGVCRPGHAVVKDELLTRARKMGENLVLAMRTPWDEVKWLGQEQGWCPICHSNLLLKGEKRWDGEQYPVECAVCAAGGNLKVEGDDISFVVDEKSLRTIRLGAPGRKDHFYEIKHNTEEFMRNSDKVQKGIARYRNYKVKGIE